MYEYITVLNVLQMLFVLSMSLSVKLCTLYLYGGYIGGDRMNNSRLPIPLIAA